MPTARAQTEFRRGRNTRLLGQFGLGVATGVVGNLGAFGAKAVLGWAANQMRLNHGTCGQLNEIRARRNSGGAGECDFPDAPAFRPPPAPPRSCSR